MLAYVDFVCAVVMLCTGADGIPQIGPDEMPIVSACFDSQVSPLDTAREIQRMRGAPLVTLH